MSNIITFCGYVKIGKPFLVLLRRFLSKTTGFCLFLDLVLC